MLSGGQGSILGSVGCISRSWWISFLNQGLRGCRKRGGTGDKDEHDMHMSARARHTTGWCPTDHGCLMESGLSHCGLRRPERHE